MKYGGVLYHGTSRALLAYAQQREGRLGTRSADICFTPDLWAARTYAYEWKREEEVEFQRKFFLDDLVDEQMRHYWGDERIHVLRRLKRQFGSIIFPLTAQPVVLAFNGAFLGDLKYTYREGDDYEEFSKKGPVNVYLAEEVVGRNGCYSFTTSLTNSPRSKSVNGYTAQH